MALEKWELAHVPSEKDSNRWQLKLKIEQRDVVRLVNEINSIMGIVSRPSLLENDEFTFSLYLYESSDKKLILLRNLLKSKCPDGRFTDPKTEETLDLLLDRIAKEIETAVAMEQKPAQPPPSKPEKTSSPGSQVSPFKQDKPKINFPVRENKPFKPDSVFIHEPVPIPKPPVHEEVIFHDLGLNPAYIFEEFVIGPSNRFTAAAAQAVADNPGKIYNPFFIYGGVGLGKTHLMHAVGNYTRKKSPSLNVLYVTTEKFMNEVIDSVRKASLQNMREHYRKIDLLLIDDIQFLVESESTQEEFFHTFNILHQNGKQIIITSDRAPKYLTTLEDRLRSRFEWGLIADIKSPNLETRVAILKKKEELEKLQLDDNILLFIASKLKSNIRELEGFLKRINAYASLTHQEVNMELVQTLMADLLPEEEMDEAHDEQSVKPKAKIPQPQPQKSEPEKPPQKGADSNIGLPDFESALSSFLKDNKKPIEEQKPLKTVPSVDQTIPPPVHEQTQNAAPHLPVTEAVQPSAAIPSTPVTPPLNAAPPSAPVYTKSQAKTPVSADSADSGLKPVQVAFFYPEQKYNQLNEVKEHFKEIIKKHKLKFRLDGIIETEYSYNEKINYTFFTDLCKANNLSIAVVLGPPLEGGTEAEDFANLLATVMEDENISLQLVSWNELNKDYRYLNLSLDITLLKHKS